MDDHEALRRFAQERSEAAFAELVRRHVDLVYGAALRQLRNSADAEDVVQIVFLALARKAAGLSRNVVVAAWLHKASVLASRNLLRARGRRRRYERAACRSETMPTSSDSSWERLAPELDEALARLGRANRTALVLRFLEGKSFPEVAAELGISQVAARQRVVRGLEHLRGKLPAGAALSAIGIGELLTAHAQQAAPAQVATQAAAMGGGAAASAHYLSLAKGVIKVMAWTKTKIAGAVALGLLLAGGAGTVVYRSLEPEQNRVVVFKKPQPSEPSTANLDDAAQRRVKAMNNMMDIVARCYAFSDSHKGAWPSSLDQLSNPAGTSQPATLPSVADQKPAYVYLPPKNPDKLKDPGKRIVVYERFDKWIDGVAVGYADGHAQFVQDEAEFRKQLADQGG
jgi:RNA polymerase sigma factor (sigma-70 family)